MDLFGGPCPECGGKNPRLAETCQHCGARLGEPMATRTATRTIGEDKTETSSTGYSVVMGIFIVISLILLAIGFFSGDISAIQQTALFAASAVFGILARIAQAGAHQVKTENLLRTLGQR